MALVDSPGCIVRESSMTTLGRMGKKTVEGKEKVKGNEKVKGKEKVKGNEKVKGKK